MDHQRTLSKGTPCIIIAIHGYRANVKTGILMQSSPWPISPHCAAGGVLVDVGPGSPGSRRPTEEWQWTLEGGLGMASLQRSLPRSQSIVQRQPFFFPGMRTRTSQPLVPSVCSIRLTVTASPKVSHSATALAASGVVQGISATRTRQQVQYKADANLRMASSHDRHTTAPGWAEDVRSKGMLAWRSEVPRTCRNHALLGG